MKALLAWLLNEPARLYAVVALGMMIGLAAAFGRERHEGRKPDRNWLANRLLLMPFLAGCSIVIVRTAGLSSEAALFVAQMLSLLAYDGLRVMRTRALAKLAGEESASEMADDLNSVGHEEAVFRLPRSDGASGLIEVVGARETPTRKELRQAYAPPKQCPEEISKLIDDLKDVD